MAALTVALLKKKLCMLNTFATRFRDILALVQIALVIQINSAECERGFSLMGRVKCDWRPFET